MNVGRTGARRLIRQCLLLCCIANIAGCSYDLRWTQKESVQVPDIGFETCIKAAVAEIPGASITGLEYDRFTLKVPFQRPMPHVSVFVQKRDEAVADIMFVGKGWRESSDEQSQIAPLLAILTVAIKRHCTNGKAALPSN